MDLLGLIILFFLPEKPNKYEIFSEDFRETLMENLKKYKIK